MEKLLLPFIYEVEAQRFSFDSVNITTLLNKVMQSTVPRLFLKRWVHNYLNGPQTLWTSEGSRPSSAESSKAFHRVTSSRLYFSMFKTTISPNSLITSLSCRPSNRLLRSSQEKSLPSLTSQSNLTFNRHANNLRT